MRKAYTAMRVAVRQQPSILPTLPKKLQIIAESLLPYSIGIEVEAHPKKSFKRPLLDQLFIGGAETQMRISKGIKGMLELKQFCDLLKEYYYFNEQSGIHYHVDFDECPDKRFMDDSLKKQILKELDSWGYTGRYNHREIETSKRVWVRIHPFHNTLEFRIGEMTFDYELMMKRILHITRICKKIKSSP